MKRLYAVRWLTAVGVVGVLITGCGDLSGDASVSKPESASPSGFPSTGTDDPVLSAASDAVDRVVHPRYDDWYTSIVLDHQNRAMTIYRKTGSDMDKAVRSQVPEVKVAFKDAAMSEKDMLALTRKVLADTDYWRRQGVVITGGGPLSDGSGIEVMTQTGAHTEAMRLSEHYDSRIVVERGGATAAPGGRFTPSS
ncbi:hypothetical protein [Streptomyces acidiscabies]|uniref:Lipoprotein n=1 Tax=Streptomyces acidiscabies TaxID=42234 RepID=A0AAP6BMA4_9ACTN|nr:hypothetical protein [Streptomyces acidiscabies]MBP5936714.1 hypothetical protein [Streptomyces sp. LBUM 1476]MBZ3915283.1 hypothetical protein [Streptomyces acidiscabies]MDX2967333.1 hypothetical protein [Streptomyces acidiscabies]MDX3026155.1 hypothetical protein [Streptomyces acidiscabies]MDX3797105.1 hypothetical protein [Streptomyces acidiscabies]